MSEARRVFLQSRYQLTYVNAQGLNKLTFDYEFYPGTESQPEGTCAASRYKAEPEPENLSRCRVLIESRCAYPGASVRVNWFRAESCKNRDEFMNYIDRVSCRASF
jgi:hypothetical protein